MDSDESTLPSSRRKDQADHTKTHKRSNSSKYQPTLATLPETQPFLSTVTEARLKALLDTQLSTFAATRSASESTLLASVTEDQAALMFAVWLTERIDQFSTLWGDEWKKRIVAEDAVRDLKYELEEEKKRRKKVEEELEGLKGLREGEKEEEEGKKLKRNSSLLGRTVEGLRKITGVGETP